MTWMCKECKELEHIFETQYRCKKCGRGFEAKGLSFKIAVLKKKVK